MSEFLDLRLCLLELLAQLLQALLAGGQLSGLRFELGGQGAYGFLGA